MTEREKQIQAVREALCHVSDPIEIDILKTKILDAIAPWLTTPDVKSLQAAITELELRTYSQRLCEINVQLNANKSALDDHEKRLMALEDARDSHRLNLDQLFKANEILTDRIWRTEK